MKFFVFCILLVLIFTVRCKNDKLKPAAVKENISSMPVTCADLSAVSYSLQIQSTINSKCITCHDASSGIKLDTYQHFVVFANSGQLIGCLTGNPDYAQMPPGESLDSCSLKAIKNWVQQGKLNN